MQKRSDNMQMQMFVVPVRKKPYTGSTLGFYWAAVRPTGVQLTNCSSEQLALVKA
jgi:hypothetical protein